MEPWIYALYIVAALAFIKIIIMLALAKGNISRIGDAIKISFSTLTGKSNIGSTTPSMPSNPKLSQASFLWPLFLLQRETRLMDFLLEDISGAPDDLVGAGVREIHQKAKVFIQDKIKITPVFNQPQGDSITLQAGFDPSEIILTGQLEGNPPYHGTLCHHGWKVEADTIPPIPDWFAKTPILAQAQIELKAK